MVKLYKTISIIEYINWIIFFILIVLSFIGNEINYSARMLMLISLVPQLIFLIIKIRNQIEIYKGKFNRIQLISVLSSLIYAAFFVFYLFIIDAALYTMNFVELVPIIFYYSLILHMLLVFLFFLFFIFNSVFNPSAIKMKIQKIKYKNSIKSSTKIRDLKKLLDEGIISKEVFDEKSKKYIEEL